MKIRFSRKFRKDVSRLKQSQKKRLKEKMGLFIKRPTHPIFNNHELKGKLKGRCSINITGDIRAIYKLKKENKEMAAEFIRLGTHNQLY